MLLKKIAPAAALALVLAGGTGLAAASTAAKEPAKSYGVCIHKTKKTWRPLEPGNLAKSRYGKCSSGETKVLLPSIDGVPAAASGPKGDIGPAGPKGDVGPAGKRGPRGSKAMPATITFKRGAEVEVCTKGDTVNGNPTYACVVTPAPSPTPTATPTT